MCPERSVTYVSERSLLIPKELLERPLIAFIHWSTRGLNSKTEQLKNCGNVMALAKELGYRVLP
ncbi:MAG: hypothetical protein LC130_22395 [Bryobacterales bacterium]|nr:hypothetical protein [Bryobacterales bacterium]